MTTLTKLGPAHPVAPHQQLRAVTGAASHGLTSCRSHKSTPRPPSASSVRDDGAHVMLEEPRGRPSSGWQWSRAHPDRAKGLRLQDWLRLHDLASATSAAATSTAVALGV
ncbi:unnamed protein product [Lampetra planeri]